MVISLTLIAGERESWLPWLLEADESEAVVRAYLHDGELYAITVDGQLAGVALLMGNGDDLEIKNLAVEAKLRGQGIGAAAIEWIARLAKRRNVGTLLVGTADTSDDALRFYRRCGFVEMGVREGFFDRYPEPVIENGRRARDMILLALRIRT